MSKIRTSSSDEKYEEVADKFFSANANDLGVGEVIDGGIGRMKFTSLPIRRIVVSGINLLATGNTTIIPAQGGKKFVRVGSPVVYITTKTGTGIVAPIIRIGNSVNKDNLVALSTLTAAVLDIIYDLVALPAVMDIDTNAIAINVQTAGTGFSVLTASVAIFGFFV